MSPFLDDTNRAAAGWLATLNAGAVSDDQRRAFNAWLAASPGNRLAWERMAGAIEQTFRPGPVAGGDDRQPARRPGPHQSRTEIRTETRPEIRPETRAGARDVPAGRRALLRAAAAVFGGAAAGAGLIWAERMAPLVHWGASLRTGTGERRTLALAGGGEITLAARSAVDLGVEAGRRVVRLRTGAVLARPMAGHDGSPSLAVRTVHGEVTAGAGRFMVRDEGGHSYVGVLTDRAWASPWGKEGRELTADQALRFGPGLSEGGTPPSPRTASAWSGGRLEADGSPLGEVVDILRDYRRGFIRISPAAAAIRLHGSFDLDDSDRVLALLASTLPIDVRISSGGWLVSIESLVPGPGQATEPSSRTPLA